MINPLTSVIHNAPKGNKYLQINKLQISSYFKLNIRYTFYKRVTSKTKKRTKWKEIDK